MDSTIVVALGGNALGNNLLEQRANVARAAIPLADLVEAGHRLAICHGNGPQVGMINLAFEAAAKSEPSIQPMPLSTDGAMSQGYIGFGIQKALFGELKRRGIEKSAATIITQVRVDPADPALDNPSKPIGSFYTEEEAQAMMAAFPDLIMRPDAGRGWRRFVPSPRPQEIIEREVIASMLDCGHVVIACGGGGLPVVPDGDGLLPFEAVIDKDLTAELLAEELGADLFMILTAVDRVCVDFGTPQQRELVEVTVKEAEEYIAQGQFAPGSMLPKVEAALRFVRSHEGCSVLICSLEGAPDALAGRSGTRFVA